ncbi:restriction endonuclease subunit S [Draconibacterium sp. IB214405]|uniref:restriction endonuclease subunit S n=1 Tax=Draconibacterium sp. IB214405 TaxID=3097352 RepID=UPI002A0CAF8D|nr:restriction endonuclease subunit S [Draconibacterium sp. IB214405]MDX8339740.1 restriction endonuclease subunit S [Draconibacterium sp. IB214405]
MVIHVPNLRFPEFSKEWDEKSLAQVTSKIGSGKTPKGGEDVYTLEGIPFIRSQNVINDCLVMDSTHIPQEVHKNMNGSKVLPHDILLNITGGSIGRSCVVPKDFIEGNVNQHVSIIRLNQDNPKFLQSILSSWRGQKLIFQSMTGSGREGLNFESIKSFKIYFPLIEEQNKVASFLQRIDERISTQNKIIENQESLMRGLIQQIVTRTIKFKDKKGNDYPDWEEKKLSEIAKYYDGTHQTPKYVEKGVPFYSVEHVTANQFSKTKFISPEVFEKENERVKLEKEDILMTRIGSIGVAKFIDWDVSASFYVSLALIKSNGCFNSQFLSFMINHQDFQKELWKRTIHVAFPQKINLGEIGECIIKLPSLSEQNKIANFLSSLDEKLENEKQVLEQYQQQKKHLLQNLFI